MNAENEKPNLTTQTKKTFTVFPTLCHYYKCVCVYNFFFLKSIIVIIITTTTVFCFLETFMIMMLSWREKALLDFWLPTKLDIKLIFFF